MTKSLVAIGGIGLGGCIVLSLLMQQALEAQREREAHPLQRTLEERFARRLVGPARVTLEGEEGEVRLVVRLCVLAGLDKARVAAAAAELASAHARGPEGAPAEVVITVTDDGDGEPVTRRIRHPALAR